MLYPGTAELWSDDEKSEAMSWIIKQYGSDWHIENLYGSFGQDEVNKRIAEAIKTRYDLIEQLFEITEIDKGKTKCHICGIRTPVCYYEFGIARKLKVHRDWSGTLVSIGISAITLPLLGAVGFKTPDRQISFKVIRLHLMVCSECKAQRLRRHNSIKLSKADYAHHPSVDKAKSLGYDKFLWKQDLDQLS